MIGSGQSAVAGCQSYADGRPLLFMPVTSYPKNKIKILLLENISDAAVAELRSHGYENIERIGGALSEAELITASTRGSGCAFAQPASAGRLRISAQTM